ncbi:MAG: hypothetical protein ACJA01_001664 [Saprospiraceae bacterium]|jgi:hypothetical protein
MSKLHSINLVSFGLLAVLVCLGYSYVIDKTLPFSKEKTVYILDQVTEATILSVKHEEKSDLLKGSILDYEGIYIAYEFHVNDRKFNKIELIKKSDRNLWKMVPSYKELVASENKAIVRYNYEDPRHSSIDYFKSIASF